MLWGDYMFLSAAEKIRILLKRRNMSIKQLADILGVTSQNVCNKLSRNNFSEKELIEIAAALDCTYNAVFTMNDSGVELK